MIEAYYKEGIKVTTIMIALGRSKQTVYHVINFLKDGHSAYYYYEHYKAKKKRCGRRKISLSQAEKDFIQTHLDRSW
ncbi:IS30 family transposase, partial [Streptococcus suis]